MQDMQGGSVGFSLFSLGFTPSTSSKDDDIAVQRAKDFYFGWWVRQKHNFQIVKQIQGS